MSWEMVKLGDVCKIESGYAFKSKDFSDEGCAIIRISNINGSIIDIKNVARVTEEAVKKAKKVKLNPNDILIAMSGATTGKVGLVPEKIKENIYLNQRLGKFKIIDNSRLLQPFLFKYVSSNIFKKQILFMAAGAAQPNISPKQIINIQTPLPPLETQKKIVNILDKAQELIDKRKQQIDLMDSLVQSLFYDMFGDPVLNLKNWELYQFKKFINDIIGGVSIGGESRKLLNGEKGVLKISAVTSGIFNPEEYKVVNKDKIPGDLVHPLKNDLLFSRANTREMVGATCIVVSDNYNLFLPDKIWKINLKETMLNKWFVKNLLTHSGFRENLKKIATGTSGSMLNISKAKLKELNIPVPPITLQNNFAEKVEKIEIQKQKMQNSLKDLEQNFSSLMQRAFKGEI